MSKAQKDYWEKSAKDEQTAKDLDALIQKVVAKQLAPVLKSLKDLETRLTRLENDH